MEDILHYVWKYKLFNKKLTTDSGLDVEVIDPGLQNTNQGPDFFNAKVKIDGKLWAGNIEIHTSSDDWNKHKHDQDQNYNSVILHIVENINCTVSNQLGQSIPQCKITYPLHIKENYDFLRHSDKHVPCANYISSIPSVHLNSWISNLVFERLNRKTEHISDLLSRFENSWEDVFYILLSRNFGFGLNSDSFERLALSLPLRYIQKQKDNIFQIETFLFGQAGMLEDDLEDKYYQLMQKEYNFLQNKYTLIPLDSFLFKKLRSRPNAFPQIRIAQLAALLYNSEGLFSKITTCEDLGQIRLMFHINASEYWQTHYAFGVESAKKSKYLGDSSLDVILINTVIPMLFSYGKKIGNDKFCERAVSFLESLKPERNSITRDFSRMKLPLKSAADSQAVIQLKKEYCELRKCLFCRIGHQLLVTT